MHVRGQEAICMYEAKKLVHLVGSSAGVHVCMSVHVALHGNPHRIVVFPALSKPSTRIRASRSPK